MTFLLRNKAPSKATSSAQARPTANLTQKAVATDQDRINDAELDAFLLENRLMDSEESRRRRLDVLTKLNTIIQQWVFEQLRKQHIPEHEVKTYRAEVISFGSYRLGVNNETGDIDVLCVCPRVISRESFFTDLRSKLEPHPETREFKSAPDTFVPLMSFMFYDVEIDLIFAQVAAPKLPTPFVVTDNVNLVNIIDVDIRALNGTRVTDKILSAVPLQASFRSTLRFIKLWAKKRGIYSNVMGYLGGVSWAILTALTCQSHPTESGSIVIREFFKMLSAWEWPKPVHLCEQEMGEDFTKMGGSWKVASGVWSPALNPKDLFPIITPAFPSANSTYNVQHVTRAILVAELKRGAEIIAKMEPKLSQGMEGQNNDQNGQNAPKPTTIDLATMRDTLLELIQDPKFFESFQHFFDIKITTNSEDEMNTWFGFVESKVKIFFNQVYSINKDRIPNLSSHPLTLRPWPYAVYNPAPDVWERHFYIGIKFNVPASMLALLDFNTCFASFLDTISKNKFKLRTDTMLADIAHIRQYQLPDWVFPDSVRPDFIPRGPVKRVRPAPGATGATGAGETPSTTTTTTTPTTTINTTSSSDHHPTPSAPANPAIPNNDPSVNRLVQLGANDQSHPSSGS